MSSVSLTTRQLEASVPADTSATQAPSKKKKKGKRTPAEEKLTPNQEFFKKIFEKIEAGFDPDPEIPTTTSHDPVKSLEKNKTLILNPSDRSLKTVAQKILGHACPMAQEGIITCETWDDLKLFSGDKDPESSFVNRLMYKWKKKPESKEERTSTELGRMFEIGLISSPTADVQVLRKRQALIKALRETHLADQIKNLFSPEVKYGEKLLLSSWDPHLPNCVNKMYYRKMGKRWLNASPFFLEAGMCYVHTKSVLNVTSQIAAAALCTVGVVNLAARYFGAPHLEQVLPTSTIAALGKFVEKQIIRKNDPIYYMSMLPWAGIKVLTMGLGSLFNSFNIKDNIRWIQAEYKTEDMLHKKFVAIASYYRAMKQIYELLKAHPEVTENLSHFNKLKEFFENRSLSTIFSSLESHTFDSEGWFYNLGKILYLADQLKKPEVIEKFEHALTAVAEIDTFVSAAKLMDEFQEERVKFCFPEYLEGKEKPELHIGNSWNPLVDPKDVTCNSVDSDGSDEDRCQLITGPNGGGKTTILRSNTGNIILGQSLGIASAEKCTMTPFKFVASSMNVVDTAGKASHFQSEVRRIADIQKRVVALREDEFGYIVLDELYNGTSDEERAALGRAAVNDLGKRKNLLSMVVTHDKALPPLAQKEKSGIKNFRVLVDDQVKPPKPLYKLEPGISTQHIGLLVASQGGVSEDQIREAQNYMDECQREETAAH